MRQQIKKTQPKYIEVHRDDIDSDYLSELLHGLCNSESNKQSH